MYARRQCAVPAQPQGDAFHQIERVDARVPRDRSAAGTPRRTTSRARGGDPSRVRPAEPVEQLDEPALDQAGIAGRVLGLDGELDGPPRRPRRARGAARRVSTLPTGVARSGSGSIPPRFRTTSPESSSSSSASSRVETTRGRSPCGRCGGRARRRGDRPRSAVRRTRGRPHPPRWPACSRQGVLGRVSRGAPVRHDLGPVSGRPGRGVTSRATTATPLP